MAEKTREQREQDSNWYVVHTYSGHENKVKANIEKMVENRGMIDDIFEVAVPTEEYVHTKDGKNEIRERKLFPGYVLIKMIIDDESWYLVRNTRGVTGFVGPGSKPIPLTEQEVAELGVQEEIITETDLRVNETINVISGPFEGHAGEIKEIFLEKQKIRVNISMFGRDTPVELEFGQVEKI